ncbi:hypothetical protein FH972_024526 [Carpinus fangiana]|uniref:Uncharacterized protein n=1 Tax=Carpinus fangiana TaxID=176857 RepID=A0A5N6KYS9_9ROSI|nr:hypothetical protein FH972_024526 [Carpinus fangiana]
MGTVVSNASPARLPGSEPLIGTYVTLERFSKQHVDDLYLSVGVDDSMWMFVPTGPFPDKQSFADMLDEGDLLKLGLQEDGVALQQLELTLDTGREQVWFYL